MTLVDDLAAAKHESLTTAANQVAAALAGNTKLFKQYGISIDAGTRSTAQISANLDTLSGKLAGQASAAANTFTGHIDAMKTKAVDFAARIGNDVGAGDLVLRVGVGHRWCRGRPVLSEAGTCSRRRAGVRGIRAG